MLISQQRLKVNEAIRARAVRLIDDKGEQVGVLPTAQAMERARETNLDLVEVSPNADPPVCKLMDFGKHLYQQRKRDQDARRKRHQVQIKEIRLRPKTDDHDRQIKLDRAKKFLEQGHRVQVNMLFRGREMQHQNLGREQMIEFAQQLEDVGKMEGRPNTSGRRMMSVTILPQAAKSQKSDSK